MCLLAEFYGGGERVASTKEGRQAGAGLAKTTLPDHSATHGNLYHCVSIQRCRCGRKQSESTAPDAESKRGKLFSASRATSLSRSEQHSSATWHVSFRTQNRITHGIFKAAF